MAENVMLNICISNRFLAEFFCHFFKSGNLIHLFNTPFLIKCFWRTRMLEAKVGKKLWEDGIYMKNMVYNR